MVFNPIFLLIPFPKDCRYLSKDGNESQWYPDCLKCIRPCVQSPEKQTNKITIDFDKVIEKYKQGIMVYPCIPRP